VSYRIGVDIGGTFTDCVVIGGSGDRTVSKALTTHDDLLAGVVQALTINAEQQGVGLRGLLERTSSFVHGTTVATNAVLTRTGSKTALITTKGHEDTLPVGKVQSQIAGLSEREIVHLSRLDKPVPIVPRELIRGVTERIDRDGDVVVPLDEAEAAETIDELAAQGVEAVAICFLWSFVNERHEQAMREIVQQRAPGVTVACSHQIAPVLGEYERTVTTVLNVYVAAKVAGYLEQLESRLAEEGLRSPLLIMQSNGGLTSAAEATRVPLLTLDSGPTGGILGCRYLGSLYDEPDMICTDVGGTSFDVGLILGGSVQLDPEPVVAQHAFRLPKVSVHSIGAGGGSIAWIDEGGLLRVGPRSAGSRPGPACYGLGGAAATVTDADLVLGYLNPDFFLGSRMSLDRERALAALATVGAQLGLEPEEAAVGIFRIVNAQMADMIRRSTIEQGYDPRQCVLVAYGGAAPTHAAFYGGEIGVKRILIPAGSTAFSAEGMLTCDVVHAAEASRLVRSPFDAAGIAAIQRDCDRLEAAVLGQFEREGAGRDAVELERVARIRYYRQVHTVEVQLDLGQLSASSLAALRDRFERTYAEAYGEGATVPGGRTELVLLRVAGTRRVESPAFLEYELADEDPAAARKGQRRAFFEPTGFTEASVFDGQALRPGNTILGPAIIERMGDSVVLPPRTRVTVDRFAALVLETAMEDRP
jgi:N-methylhydantoinase A